MAESLYRIALFFPAFLFALCFHEFAHGWVAKLKGDRTAEMMGRLTLNPISHMDPIGTVALPLLAIVSGFPFFGWAKPVPVDSRNLKNPRVDLFWIAAAGPLSNILLALVACIGLAGVIAWSPPDAGNKGIYELLNIFIVLNLFLAVFNMLPLHPLDGGKVLARFLPEEWNRFLEANEQTTSFILLGLFIFGGLKFIAGPVFWASGQLTGVAVLLSGFLA